MNVEYGVILRLFDWQEDWFINADRDARFVYSWSLLRLNDAYKKNGEKIPYNQLLETFHRMRRKSDCTKVLNTSIYLYETMIAYATNDFGVLLERSDFVSNTPTYRDNAEYAFALFGSPAVTLTRSYICIPGVRGKIPLQSGFKIRGKVILFHFRCRSGVWWLEFGMDVFPEYEEQAMKMAS